MTEKLPPPAAAGPVLAEKEEALSKEQANGHSEDREMGGSSSKQQLGRALQLPAKLGFHMPAEWALHKQTWMGWPTRTDNWRERAEPAQAAFARVAAAIMEFEPVTIGVGDERKLDNVRKQLCQQIEVVYIKQDDAWFRDSGPTFLLGPEAPGGTGERQLAAVDWKFNAWGNKVKNYADDAMIADRILFLENVRSFKAPFYLEGGSIHTDGEGTLLTTEECLLNPNRNPDKSKEELEALLKDYLGMEKVLWIPRGLYADYDTDGHVDNFCCFARPGEVLLAWTDDTSDPQYERSMEALHFLENATDAKGRSLKVIKLPTPPVLQMSAEEFGGLGDQKNMTSPREAGERLAASYINFYLPNGGVVMPAFGGEAAEADARAQKIMEEVFPERKVVAVQTRDVLLGGGNIHCITQQQPSTTPPLG